MGLKQGWINEGMEPRSSSFDFNRTASRSVTFMHSNEIGNEHGQFSTSYDANRSALISGVSKGFFVPSLHDIKTNCRGIKRRRAKKLKKLAKFQVSESFNSPRNHIEHSQHTTPSFFRFGDAKRSSSNEISNQFHMNNDINRQPGTSSNRNKGFNQYEEEGTMTLDYAQPEFTVLAPDVGWFKSGNSETTELAPSYDVNTRTCPKFSNTEPPKYNRKFFPRDGTYEQFSTKTGLQQSYNFNRTDPRPQHNSLRSDGITTDHSRPSYNFIKTHSKLETFDQFRPESSRTLQLEPFYNIETNSIHESNDFFESDCNKKKSSYNANEKSPMICEWFRSESRPGVQQRQSYPRHFQSENNRYIQSDLSFDIDETRPKPQSSGTVNKVPFSAFGETSCRSEKSFGLKGNGVKLEPSYYDCYEDCKQFSIENNGFMPSESPENIDGIGLGPVKFVYESTKHGGKRKSEIDMSEDSKKFQPSAINFRTLPKRFKSRLRKQLKNSLATIGSNTHQNPVDNSQCTKIAITKESFPRDKITPRELNLIQEEILRQIDRTPSSEPLPLLKTSYLINGVLFYICANEQTSSWVKTNLFKFKLGNRFLKIIGAENLILPIIVDPKKPIKMAFITNDILTKDAEKLLSRLKTFNPALNTVHWRILGSYPDSLGMRWILQVDRDSANAIKNAGFKAYTGIDEGTFETLYDPFSITSSQAVPLNSCPTPALSANSEMVVITNDNLVEQVNNFQIIINEKFTETSTFIENTDCKSTVVVKNENSQRFHKSASNILSTAESDFTVKSEDDIVIDHKSPTMKPSDIKVLNITANEPAVDINVIDYESTAQANDIEVTDVLVVNANANKHTRDESALFAIDPTVDNFLHDEVAPSIPYGNVTNHDAFEQSDIAINIAAIDHMGVKSASSVSTNANSLTGDEPLIKSADDVGVGARSDISITASFINEPALSVNTNIDNLAGCITASSINELALSVNTNIDNPAGCITVSSINEPALSVNTNINNPAGCESSPIAFDTNVNNPLSDNSALPIVDDNVESLTFDGSTLCVIDEC